MKAILVLTALAVSGFGLAACGSGAKIAGDPGTTTFTSPVTTTIAEVQTGDAMTCDGMAGAQVPRPGHGVSNATDGTSKSAILYLNRLADGSLVVTCTG